MKIAIVTDSTCDLPAEVVNQYGITVIPLSINVGDKPFLDGVDLSREEFYFQLPNFNPHPKTAAPGLEVFTQEYNRLAIEGASAVTTQALLHMNMSNATAHRTRTRSKAMSHLFSWLNEYAPYEKLAIVHAGVEEEARAFYHLAKSFLPDGEIPIIQITPVLGAHLGIGALGFACISKE